MNPNMAWGYLLGMVTVAPWGYHTFPHQKWGFHEENQQLRQGTEKIFTTAVQPTWLMLAGWVVVVPPPLIDWHKPPPCLTIPNFPIGSLDMNCLSTASIAIYPPRLRCGRPKAVSGS